jgi:hypothetical protein
MEILVPISLGELYDKISILSIKSQHIKEGVGRVNIISELSILQNMAMKYIIGNDDLALYRVNQELWDVEDKLRLKEEDKLFDDEFIQLARSVYFLNDERAKIKKEINLKYGSDIIEEKQYTEYKR